MSCNPPYARGVTGHWDKCEFPGVLRQDCYDYINFDYDCGSKPDCPDRVVVIEVCDTNAARDDNIRVTLNGTVIASVLDFSKDERNGYFLIADSNATLEASESSIPSCHGTSPGLPISVKRFSPDSIKGGVNIINVKIVQLNNNGNAGAFNVRSYVKRNGKLICGCSIQSNITYGAEGDYTFTYDNCCGTNEVPSCPTPTPAATPAATPAVTPAVTPEVTISTDCNCCVYSGIIDDYGHESFSCIVASSESDCYSQGGTYYKSSLFPFPFSCTTLKTGKCCGPDTSSCNSSTGPTCRSTTKAGCNAVGGVFQGYGTGCSSEEKCTYPCSTTFFSATDFDEVDFMQRYPPELYGFGFNDCSYEYPSLYQSQALIQPEPEPVFSTQATDNCNITIQLRTTGCCLEVEESTGRVYSVGSGTVSARIVSGYCSRCSDFSVYINEKKNSAVVQDGSTIIISGRSTKCKCSRKTPWKTTGGFMPGPCYKASPYRILKNIETGVYQIELNTNSSQNDCGCG